MARFMPQVKLRNSIVDRRALKILFDTFWSAGGWKPDPLLHLSREDFHYAKSKGVMYDPVTVDHRQVVEQLSTCVGKLNRRVVADAFLASLSTRRLDWRSALGSYSIFQHLQPHSSVIWERRCGICGFYLNQTQEDLNVLNFERLKWGGIRHIQVDYAAFDLRMFLEIEPPKPCAADIEIFYAILSAISSVAAAVKSAALQTSFADAIISNKAERDVIVAILGFCDVLGTPDHPGFSDSFIPETDREIPNRRFVDMPYPSCWWTSDVGINQERLHDYFGHVL